MAAVHPKSIDPLAERRVSMRDVARKAGGVHHTTVSAALRNCPGISEALRLRIKHAARQLGYKPDPLLKTFNAHRIALTPKEPTDVIALLIEAEAREAWKQEPDLQKLVQGASLAALETNARIEVFEYGNGGMHSSRLNVILRTRGIHGVILGPCSQKTRSVDLDWERYCAIRIDSDHLRTPAHQVGNDHMYAVHTLWTQLRKQGFKRIGLYLPEDTEESGFELKHASALLLKEQPLAASFSIRTQALTTQEAARAWVEKGQLQAVIVPTLEMAKPIAGLKHTNSKELELCALSLNTPSEQLSGILVNKSEIGRIACELLHCLLKENVRCGSQTPSTSTYVRGTWCPKQVA